MGFFSKLKSKLTTTDAQRAARIQELRKKRIKREGTAKLIRLENKERARLAKASATINKNRFSKLKKVANSINSTTDSMKKERKSNIRDDLDFSLKF